MIFVPFNELQLSGLNVREEQREEFLNHLQYLPAYANTYAFTAMYDGEVIAMGGVVTVQPGNGELWALFSDKLPRYRKSIIKEVKWHIENMMTEYVRLQAQVRADFPQGQRFVEWLGFEKVGLDRMYANGRDYFRYALIKE
jgi:RimJ/RimL family protein N-acetyltransferase